MCVVSVHQPNFCPRRSYFEKIEQSDLFVIMSHCQYNSSGYQNRFNVGDKYYGMAVNKEPDLIINKTYNNIERDWKKITARFPRLKIFDSYINSSVAITNMHIILNAVLLLGIKADVLFDYPTELTGTARLVDICKRYGATKYLSGISGKNYLDLKQFEEIGIEVIFQDETKIDKRPLIEFI